MHRLIIILLYYKPRENGFMHKHPQYKKYVFISHFMLREVNFLFRQFSLLFYKDGGLEPQ